jgi:hypothetical protein
VPTATYHGAPRFATRVTMLQTALPVLLLTSAPPRCPGSAPCSARRHHRDTTGHRGVPPPRFRYSPRRAPRMATRRSLPGNPACGHRSDSDPIPARCATVSSTGSANRVVHASQASSHTSPRITTTSRSGMNVGVAPLHNGEPVLAANVRARLPPERQIRPAVRPDSLTPHLSRAGSTFG